MCCSEHAGVDGNDRADSHGGKATIIGGFCLRGSHAFRSWRYYLQSQSEAHHNNDCLEERGVERGCARQSCMKEPKRTMVH